jgi:hypothetical protein
MLGAPPAARAWGSREHRELGASSYLAACARLATELGGRAGAGTDARQRLEWVCGNNARVLANLYGEATSLAGDFLAQPSDFLSTRGLWAFRNKKHYWLLALENSEHFHPLATLSWRDHHRRAVDHALEAARTQGLASLAALEQATHESAFADHFLHDSFAAGHMGFNRTASSAAASKAFHDSWSGRGRVVTDRAGRRWRTYGDHRLDSKENEDGRRHVLEAATLSVHGVLAAFVEGQRLPAEELEVWSALPFTIEAPELLDSTTELFTGHELSDEREQVPLLGPMRPARKDTVGGVRLSSAASFADAGDPIVYATAGLELAVPRLPAQTYLGAGATVREPGSGHSAVLDTGLLRPFGLTVDGLISHQIDATVSWVFRSRLTAVAHVEYRLNVELGTFLLSLHLGLAELFPDPRTGWFAALGVGETFSAAGGGAGRF